ncbi:unnamed protein product [Meloidogyne enterolobii]|uniref:Uncharacterized protein n=1 Tax=Meloidogyne enterolobii TaxID=390850 RepID=A0ACB0XV21_MELEN
MRESLETILEIHSFWLTNRQEEELREDLKNGKSLDGEIYEKVYLWLLSLELTEMKEAASDVFKRCNGFSLEELRDANQRAEILIVELDLKYFVARCNNFEDSLVKLATIVDEKWKRNDIVRKYCNLTNTNTKIRNKRETRGLSRSDYNYLKYFKILNLTWLDDNQRKYLREMMAERKTRVEMRDTVVEWFNHLQPEAKERAADLFKVGCNKLLKIRQDGCDYFGLLDSQKINELKNYDDSTTYDKIKELIAPLKEKVELRNIARDYNQTCRELFGIGEEEEIEEREGGRQRRSYNKRRNSRAEQETEEETEEEDNREYNSRVLNVEVTNDEQSGRDDEGEEDHDFGDEHLNAHRTWLTSNQKRYLKRMREKGHENHEIHEKINEYHETSPDEVKKTAQAILKRGCESVFQRLFGEYIADEIIRAREQGASTAELDEKINTALGHIKNAKKRKEATRFAATCRRIFTMIERRRRGAVSTPIEDSRQ